ncbi:MAG: amino acid synthesis family protein [Chloroflexota bacterium]
MEIRKIVVEVTETHAVTGRRLDQPTRQAVASVVVKNPFAGRYAEDVAPLVDLGADVGRLLAERAMAALPAGTHVSAYGKGAIVGTDGELEHAAAILHPKFGAPVRAVVGGGPSIIPSTKLVGGPGTLLAMPIVNRDDIWSFDEMDAATVQIPDAPRADEIVVSLALAAGGRPAARTRKAS